VPYRVQHPLLQRNAQQALAANERVSTVTDEQRREGREKIRRQIAEGYIDIGPVVDHSKPVIDNRDLRKPALLGAAITSLGARRDSHQLSASQRYDSVVAHEYIPPYQDDDKEDHPLRYRKELEARAAEGDRYAASVLRGESLAEEPVD
jgi:hypothetical protein